MNSERMKKEKENHLPLVAKEREFITFFFLVSFDRSVANQIEQQTDRQRV